MDAKTRAIVLSGVSEISVKNIERGETDPRSSTLAAIQDAFSNAGVVFLVATRATAVPV
jgi:predicted transcriptional regulator